MRRLLFLILACLGFFFGLLVALQAAEERPTPSFQPPWVVSPHEGFASKDFFFGTPAILFVQSTQSISGGFNILGGGTCDCTESKPIQPCPKYNGPCTSYDCVFTGNATKLCKSDGTQCDHPNSYGTCATNICGQCTLSHNVSCSP